MRKLKPFLQMANIAIFALIVIGISASAAAGRKKPYVTRNDNVMILEYGFNEPVVIKQGDIDYVAIGGLKMTNEPGAPVLPVLPAAILVPAGMKIANITSAAIDTYQLPDVYRLSHGQKPRRKPPYGKKVEPAPQTQPDPEIFSMTTFWPAKQHDLITAQTNRGYNIAHVNIFPLQYSPKTGKIKTATKMRLTVHVAPADSHHRAKPTKYLKKKLRRELDNPDTMETYDTDSLQAPSPPSKGPGDPPPLNDLPGSYKYIVITNDSLAGYSGANSFQSLCDSKIVRGITAGIVTTEWIYANYDGTKPSGGSDNQTKIRNFLIDAYQTWGTEYALLAGDKDIIPVRKFRSDGDDIPADMYYGCVDPADCTFDNDGDGKYGESNDGVGGGEVDLTAEIFIGRAAVENSTDVANFVNKTLVYGSTTDPYLDHAMTGGGYLGFGGIADYNKPFSELIRLGSDLYTGHFTCGFESPGIANARDFNVTTLYDADGTWTAAELIAILNGTDGNVTPQLIYIADHGSTTVGMVRLNTTTLSSLNNTIPFFFYDDSCYCGSFDYNNCFGEVVTTMQYGAFACILNSRYGWGGTAQNPLDSPTTQMTREFFHSVLGEGIFELGRAHLEAKESCIWRLSYTRYDIYQSTLFGDPELRLRVTNDETSPCEYTCGDLDGQGINVNLADYALFANCWGEDPLINSSCACANLVEFNDHVIDLYDLSVFAGLFLSSSEEYPPNCSTSIIDPYAPTPDPMSFKTAPYATGATSIKMVAVSATDVSGVEYYFTCTAGGGHDSGWQDSRTYEDTGLTPDTEYTYTVAARDKSAAHNQTAASGPATATTEKENVVLPANGGTLESFTSEYGSGWVASDLTNGVTNEDGWSSALLSEPPVPQEFVYSFRDGKNAILNEAVIHGGTGEGRYYSKDVEVWTSANGTSYTIAGSDTLLDANNDSATIDLGDVVAKKIKLVVTSGYRNDYWELAEVVVYGSIIN
jgi:hypothetical protein